MLISTRYIHGLMPNSLKKSLTVSIIHSPVVYVIGGKSSESLHLLIIIAGSAEPLEIVEMFCAFYCFDFGICSN